MAYFWVAEPGWRRWYQPLIRRTMRWNTDNHPTLVLQKLRRNHVIFATGTWKRSNESQAGQILVASSRLFSYAILFGTLVGLCSYFVDKTARGLVLSTSYLFPCLFVFLLGFTLHAWEAVVCGPRFFSLLHDRLALWPCILNSPDQTQTHRDPSVGSLRSGIFDLPRLPDGLVEQLHHRSSSSTQSKRSPVLLPGDVCVYIHFNCTDFVFIRFIIQCVCVFHFKIVVDGDSEANAGEHFSNLIASVLTEIWRELCIKWGIFAWTNRWVLETEGNVELCSHRCWYLVTESGSQATSARDISGVKLWLLGLVSSPASDRLIHLQKYGRDPEKTAFRKYASEQRRSNFTPRLLYSINKYNPSSRALAVFSAFLSNFSYLQSKKTEIKYPS